MTCFCSKHSRLTQLPPRRQRLYRPQDHVRPRESRRYRTVSNRHESDRGVLTRPIRERLVPRRRAYRRTRSIAAESSFRVNLACVRFPQKPVSVLSVRLSPQRAADNDTDTTPRSFPLSYTGCRFIVYRILLSGVFCSVLPVYPRVTRSGWLRSVGRCCSSPYPAVRTAPTDEESAVRFAERERLDYVVFGNQTGFPALHVPQVRRQMGFES